MRKKRGEILNSAIIQLIIIGLVFAGFLFATAQKINARSVHQQVLEKQTALLIDSAVPGMSFEVYKRNENGVVSSVTLKDSKIFIQVNGINSINGYPYFSKYSVNVVEEEDKFVVKIDE